MINISHLIYWGQYTSQYTSVNSISSSFLSPLSAHIVCFLFTFDMIYSKMSPFMRDHLNQFIHNSRANVDPEDKRNIQINMTKTNDHRSNMTKLLLSERLKVTTVCWFVSGCLCWRVSLMIKSMIERNSAAVFVWCVCAHSVSGVPADVRSGHREEHLQRDVWRPGVRHGGSGCVLKSDWSSAETSANSSHGILLFWIRCRFELVVICICESVWDSKITTVHSHYTSICF